MKLAIRELESEITKYVFRLASSIEKDRANIEICRQDILTLTEILEAVKDVSN